MSTILLFNITDPEKRTAIRLTALRLGLAWRDIAPEAQWQTLEILLQGDGAPASADGEAFSEELLVMEALSGEQFHGLLDTLRREGQNVRLKAVVTEHNRQWTAQRLYRELRAEAEAMERRARSVHAPDRKKRR